MQIDGSWGNDAAASAAVSETPAVPNAVKEEGIAGAKRGGLDVLTAERIAAATASGVISQVQHCICWRIRNLPKALEGSHAQHAMSS